MATPWDTVAVVGVGLIGGSVGLALRERRLAERVIGIGRRHESLQRALEYEAVTDVTTDLQQGVSQAQISVVCAPVQQIPELVLRVAAACPADGVVTDVGSTKAEIVRQVEASAVDGQAAFVGSHPLAGSEKAGVEHAREDLFVGRTVVVTPSDRTPSEAARQILAFWTQLGANGVTLAPGQHDEAVAATSHLPHLIASALAAATPEVYLPLAATGWLDSTRTAAGDVELWRQILEQNRESVLRALAQFEKVLGSFNDALQQRNDAVISELLTLGKQRRDALAD